MRGMTHGFMNCTYICTIKITHKCQGAIAKWLQRQIRNLFLFEGAGSNPAGVGNNFFLLIDWAFLRRLVTFDSKYCPPPYAGKEDSKIFCA